MRVTVITPNRPPQAGRDVTGTDRRHALFIGAPAALEV
jgi:hypothetical protein